MAGVHTVEAGFVARVTEGFGMGEEEEGDDEGEGEEVGGSTIAEGVGERQEGGDHGLELSSVVRAWSQLEKQEESRRGWRLRSAGL